MKKIMEQVLQKHFEVGHESNLKQLEQSKIDPKEAMTFHNGEQNKLEDITKNIEPEIKQPTTNHPPELQCMKTKPKTPHEPIWNPMENITFWYHETVVTSPHAK
jgi:hypothetical protein